MSYNFRWRYNHFPQAAALHSKLHDQLSRTLSKEQCDLAAIELSMTFWDTCGTDAQVVKALLRFARKYGIEVAA